MMPQDVQEIFGATAVGASSLAVALFLVYWGLRLFDKPLFVPATCMAALHENQGAALALFFPLVFGFGLIVQDSADHLTDSAYGRGARRVSKILEPAFVLQRCLLGSEGDYRLAVLFDDERQSPSALWRHVAAKPADVEVILTRTCRHRHDCATDVESFIHDIADFKKKKRDDAVGFANAIFYEAKNWAYGRASYFDELQSIQRRIDFARSFFFVISSGLLAFLLFTVIGFLCQWKKQGVRVLCRAAVMAVAAILLCLIVSDGYANASRNFNERALGYYFSHRHQTLFTR
jgi:hypothetical protein